MWNKLSDDILYHPKLQAISKDAKLLYWAGLGYCARELTDGFLNITAVRVCAALVDSPVDEANNLVAVKLWEPAEGGYKVHDWHVYNPSASEVRSSRIELSRTRSEAGKRGAERRWGEGRMANGMANDMANEIGSGLQTHSNGHDPVARSPVTVPASPSPYLQNKLASYADDGDMSVEHFISKLDIKAWAKNIGLTEDMQVLDKDIAAFRSKNAGERDTKAAWLERLEKWVRRGIKTRQGWNSNGHAGNSKPKGNVRQPTLGDRLREQREAQLRQAPPEADPTKYRVEKIREAMEKEEKRQQQLSHETAEGGSTMPRADALTAGKPDPEYNCGEVPF